MKMKLYEAQLDEALEAQLIAFSRDWEAEDSCRGYRANAREDFREQRVFLAEEKGELIGYLFGHAERAKETSSVMCADTPYFEIEEIYIVPARRSQGVGRALFRFVEQTLRDEGLTYLMLSTATKNARAILHFYLDELDMTFWSARLFKRLE